jgi:hypothetical protein
MCVCFLTSTLTAAFNKLLMYSGSSMWENSELEWNTETFNACRLNVALWCRMSQKCDACTRLCSSCHWLGLFSVAFRYSWLAWLQVTMALVCAKIEWDMMKVRLLQLHPEIYNMIITYTSLYSVCSQLVLGQVKVKLSLFWIKHHTVKTFWGVEV